MTYFKIIGFTVTALFATILFRRMKEEYALFISLFAGITLTLTALSVLQPVLTYMDSLGRLINTKGIFPLIFKSAGVAVITTVGVDLCKDAGESSLGARLEMCGKALILSFALPLIKRIFESCLTLLG